MSKFFTLPVTNDILCLDGLQSIKIFTEEDNDKPYMRFVYDRNDIEINFESDDAMFDYRLSLMNWLKVKTIESYSYYEANKRAINRQEGE